MFRKRQVGVTGRIQTGSYEKDGRKIYTTDVIADRVEFLDRGNSNSETYSQPEVNNPFDNEDDQLPAGFAKLTDDDIPF